MAVCAADRYILMAADTARAIYYRHIVQIYEIALMHPLKIIRQSALHVIQLLVKKYCLPIPVNAADPSALTLKIADPVQIKPQRPGFLLHRIIHLRLYLQFSGCQIQHFFNSVLLIWF